MTLNSAFGSKNQNKWKPAIISVHNWTYKLLTITIQSLQTKTDEKTYKVSYLIKSKKW